jgi:hypothetical protein
MTSLTGADTYFTNVDTDITRTQWEACIDQAIDKINGYGYQYGITIPNMGGVAGAKTWTGTSAEAGFIRSIAILVYAAEYKGAGAASESYGLGSLSHSQSTSSSTSMAGGAIDELAREAAECLRDLDLTVGADMKT